MQTPQVHCKKKSIWGSYYHHVQLWKCSSENIALLKEVRDIRFGLEIRGQACCWRLCGSLFVWISNCETWKMWSLTKCDISGLMLLIWCVKWCRMCRLQCTEQILLANQDRCNQIRWWILLRVYTFLFVFLHFYIHANEYVHKIQVAENVFVDQVDWSTPL